jgi:FlaA1/EpsC-like NDP-sugar epimerase
MNAIFADWLTGLSRKAKVVLLWVGDFLLLQASIYLAFILSGKDFSFSIYFAWAAFAISPILFTPLFTVSGMYSHMVRFIGLNDFWRIIRCALIYSLTWSLFLWISQIQSLTRELFFIHALLVLASIGGGRMGAAWLIQSSTTNGLHYDGTLRKIIIWGTGVEAVQLCSALKNSRQFKMVGFVDDANFMQGRRIDGHLVRPLFEYEDSLKASEIHEVFLAITPTSRKKRAQIARQLEKFEIKIRILPGLEEMAQGKVTINELRVISVEDLLARDVVIVTGNCSPSRIQNISVMVTGAGGSIGSELCRQIIKQKPSCLVLFEQSEFALYSIERELRRRNPQMEYVAMLGDVCDQTHLQKVIEDNSVKTIYHAAAYKHVHLVEKNPLAGVKINILGTYSAVAAARQTEVETFVLISTDKAVRPTSVMGATKRFAELILQAYSKKKGISTRFINVRFGNVLGSSGSVVPLFQQQISDGGPVTVTHPKVLRYFMTIPEAAQLVIHAGDMGRGGEVFMLDMGEPVLISELAKNMIHLSGLSVRDENNPDGDIEIVYTGLRAGEKLAEELTIGQDLSGTEHPRILSARESDLSRFRVEGLLGEFKDLVCIKLNHSDQREAVMKLLRTAVEGFPFKSGAEVSFPDSEPKDKLGSKKTQNLGLP